ncbi:hypothetical protein GGI35DRAFT_486006 [Trichoderma velutinum]
MSLATTPGEAHLPFRRSCDRCHDQKVRCMRTQESSNPITDSEPCVRCKRSGSICIFSPQQKPGRPPLGSDTRETTSSAMYSRKRPRQSLGSVELPQSPPPTCPPSVTSLPDSAPIVGSLGLNSTLFSPFTTGDELGDGCASSYDADFLMSIPTMASIDSLPSQKHNRSVCERNVTNPIVDMIERDTEELGILCLQVCHAAKALSLSYPTSLAVSSPSLNEIFASTEALVSIIHRNTSSGSNSSRDDLFSDADPAGFSHQQDWDEFSWLQGPPHNRWAAPQASPTINRAPDTGVVLMILACHQRLLVTFGGILFYISRHLRQQKPRGLPIGASPFIEMPTTQALIIVNLVSHQLHRLDRAVGLLAEDGETARRQLGSAAQTAATGALSPLSPEQFHSPQFVVSAAEEQSSQSKLKTAANGDSGERGISISIDSSSSGSHKAIISAIDMMIYRQEQLQKQMKMVKQQIMSFDSI